MKDISQGDWLRIRSIVSIIGDAYAEAVDLHYPGGLTDEERLEECNHYAKQNRDELEVRLREILGV